MRYIDPVLIVTKKEGMMGQTSVGNAMHRSLRVLDVPVRIFRWKRIDGLDDILFRDRPEERCLVTRGGHPKAKALFLTLALHSLGYERDRDVRLVGVNPAYLHPAVRFLCLSISSGLSGAVKWLYSNPSKTRPCTSTVRAARAAFRMNWHNPDLSNLPDSERHLKACDSWSLLDEFASFYPKAPLVQLLLGDHGQAVYQAVADARHSPEAGPKLEHACRGVSQHLARW